MNSNDGLNCWDTGLFSSPIFASLQTCQSFIEFKHWPSLQDYNRLNANKSILNKMGKLITFVSSNKSNEFHLQYEPRIYLSSEVQTRTQNWHDFFNAMVWLTFPKTKAILNEKQYFALRERLPHNKIRTPLENALTLFDENGAIVISDNAELLELLKNFKWHELFWLNRDKVIKHMRFYIFGHSVYEKALRPYIGMTASSLLFHVENEFFKHDMVEQIYWIDRLIEKFFAEGVNVTSDLLEPLPVLGIPGWYKDNEQELFYANKKYFRSG